MSLNWNFQRGGEGGSHPKKPLWQEYGYFLEQHIFEKLGNKWTGIKSFHEKNWNLR